jgi:hypothetical protein
MLLDVWQTKDLWASTGQLAGAGKETRGINALGLQLPDFVRFTHKVGIPAVSICKVDQGKESNQLPPPDGPQRVPALEV